MGHYLTKLPRFCPFFDHLLPQVDILYLIRVEKRLNILTTYPPPLVTRVKECPLTKIISSFAEQLRAGISHYCVTLAVLYLVPVCRYHMYTITLQSKRYVYGNKSTYLFDLDPRCCEYLSNCNKYVINIMVLYIITKS